MGSATYVGGSHLVFSKLRLEKGLKLNKYKVFNDNLFQTIGEIHWRGGWRQYVFQALPETDMSRSCHKEIDKFIDKLMKEWKNKKKKGGGKQNGK
jgi:hypothetical protein